MAKAIRPQQYRIGWPLSPDQVEHIDTMFETLFRAVRQLGTGTASATTDEPIAEQAFGLAGSTWRDLSEADNFLPFVPGPQGATGDKGEKGNPGIDGQDGGADFFFAQPPNTPNILTPPYGGTGTGVTFTQGSVVFAGAGGVYTENNSNFNWDNAAQTLKLGGSTPILSFVGTEGSAKSYQIKESAGVLIVKDTTDGAPFIKFTDSSDFAFVQAQLAGTVLFTIGNSTRGLQISAAAAGGATDPIINAQSGSHIYFWQSSLSPLDVSTTGVTINANAANVTASASTTLKVNGQDSTFVGKFMGSITAGASFGLRVSAGTNSSDVTFSVLDTTETTDYLRIRGDGNVGVRTAGNTITARLHIGAGSASASTAPLKFTSGTNLTTAEAGAMEYNGTNLFFTRAGTVRENVLIAIDNVAAPTTNAGIAIANYYGSAATNFLGDPNRWLSVNILGSTYKIPLYT